MKKKIFAVLLSILMLMPACDYILTDSGITDSQSVSTSSDKGESGSQGGNASTGSQDQNHKDGNDDGVCDDCKASVLVEFDFIGVNDLHGKFADTNSNEGVDELSTYIKQARRLNENTVVLSSGDMWQGSSESNLTKGNIITEWMNEMDFVSMTLGNHEYDWGEEYIVQNNELADFPFLGINVYSTATNKRVDYCAPSVTVEKNGVKIGVIGAIGDCLSSISGEYTDGIEFKTGSELTALVKAEADKLRAEGADFIVYSIHDGHGSSYNFDKTLSSFGYYDTVLSGGYVDLVFEGHSHQHYVIKDGKGVYHLQGGGDNDGISVAEVKINSVTGSSTVTKADFISTATYDNLADDPVVDNLMTKYAGQIASAGRVLGYNDRYRNSTTILNKCAELYYEAGIARWGKQYQIVLGGGFMSARSPYSLQAGTVTYGDVQSILPFDNQLVLCSIKGYYLRTKFFETDNDRYYISYGAYGESVRNNIDDNATYYLVTDTYSSTYKSNRLTEIERYDAGVYARDLLANYIENGGWGV